MSMARKYLEVVLGSVGKSGKRLSVNYRGSAVAEAIEWAQRLSKAREKNADPLLTPRYCVIVDRTNITHVVDLTKIVHIAVYGGETP